VKFNQRKKKPRKRKWQLLDPKGRPLEEEEEEELEDKKLKVWL
jgi:hypothetical protein